jgi:REP element-mobilizing transposase RayT
MNIYFLVEGRRSEKKVYPQWLSYLLPGLTQVRYFDEAKNHNFYLFSSNGYPSILDDIKNAAEDINSCGKYAYLVVCLDADESTVEEKREEINEIFQPGSLELKAELVIIVQNRCFETWFLGNRKVFPRNPQDEIFREYCRFYNVSIKDPELMPNFAGFNRIAQFHEDYLKRMLREKGIRYTKRNPGNVGEPHYIEALQKRTGNNHNHLKTLKYFFQFCESIHRSLNQQT